MLLEQLKKRQEALRAQISKRSNKPVNPKVEVVKVPEVNPTSERAKLLGVLKPAIIRILASPEMLYPCQVISFGRKLNGVVPGFSWNNECMQLVEELVREICSSTSSIELTTLEGNRLIITKVSVHTLCESYPDLFKHRAKREPLEPTKPLARKLEAKRLEDTKRTRPESSLDMETSLPKKAKLLDEFSDASELQKLLSAKSHQELTEEKSRNELTSLLNKPSSMEKIQHKSKKTKGGSVVREFCQYGTKAECRAARKQSICCEKIHYIRVIQAHTVPELGDCSYLDGCRHMNKCRFVHYQIDNSIDGIDEYNARSKQLLAQRAAAQTLPAQWLNCDVRRVDLRLLGKFSVIMADPPWDIHMNLPYGTLTDREMLDLKIEELSDSGVIFLWVTGRAMELGRQCLEKWGYTSKQELIWIKTNALQRLIRTGRTGHWLNHSKEHCLIGVKGNPEVNRKIDCDVILAEVRETSRKPDEIYNIIERLSPGRKIEIFGRKHNIRPGWITIGNQLGQSSLSDKKLEARIRSSPAGFNLF